MKKRGARKRLNKFEILIGDAIALLIGRGEIEIPERKGDGDGRKTKRQVTHQSDRSSTA
jgi:hypothetical protein